MGNITIQGDLTGDVPGGEVGGASNLTTVGAIPYVSAAGILNQDPTALFWDAANNRLGVGGSPVAGYTQTIVAPDNFTGTALILRNSGLNQSLQLGWSGIFASSNFSLGAGGNFHATLVSNGNLLIGTTTDSNFKLDVAASGSAGTARFYGGAGVSNITTVVVQAGGGQSNNPVFVVQDSGGSGVLTVNTGFSYTTTSLDFGNGSRSAELRTTGFVTGSTTPFKFSSTANSNGTADLSLSRASAGVLQVGDGGSNANGVVSLTRSQHAGVLVAALPAAAAGNAGSIQYVTDANATTIGSTVAGGGANKVMVWSDGAVWKIFAS